MPRGYCISVDNLPSNDSHLGQFYDHHILVRDGDEPSLERIVGFSRFNDALRMALSHLADNPAHHVSVRPYRLRRQDYYGPIEGIKVGAPLWSGHQA